LHGAVATVKLDCNQLQKECAMEVSFIRKDDVPGEPEQRMVWAEVYAPDRPDSDGEFMTAEEIRKMAYAFSKKMAFDQVDHQHDNEVTAGVCIVESFIARKGDPDFIAGAWVVGVHIPDDGLWDMVKKGEINGFSMEALVCREEVEVDIVIPPVVSGMTSKSEDHTHEFYVNYDNEGHFRGGVTSKVNDHVHQIIAGTVTEKAEDGHSHLFSSVDPIYIKP
jgi:hypothetical protein